MKRRLLIQEGGGLDQNFHSGDGGIVISKIE
jgi:hypothetical protein